MERSKVYIYAKSHILSETRGPGGTSGPNLGPKKSGQFLLGQFLSERSQSVQNALRAFWAPRLHLRRAPRLPEHFGV